eukprot:jgi/Bigna1/136887/aug1.36_g11595
MVSKLLVRRFKRLPGSTSGYSHAHKAWKENFNRFKELHYGWVHSDNRLAELEKRIQQREDGIENTSTEFKNIEKLKEEFQVVANEAKEKLQKSRDYREVVLESAYETCCRIQDREVWWKPIDPQSITTANEVIVSSSATSANDKESYSLQKLRQICNLVLQPAADGFHLVDFRKEFFFSEFLLLPCSYFQSVRFIVGPIILSETKNGCFSEKQMAKVFQDVLTIHHNAIHRRRFGAMLWDGQYGQCLEIAPAPRGFKCIRSPVLDSTKSTDRQLLVGFLSSSETWGWNTYKSVEKLGCKEPFGIGISAIVFEHIHSDGIVKVQFHGWEHSIHEEREILRQLENMKSDLIPNLSEYDEDGSDHLVMHPIRYPTREIIPLSHVAALVIGCLKELHQEGYVHYDLKPENLMWKYDANEVSMEENELAIVDFHTMRKMKDRFVPRHGTPTFTAEEVHIAGLEEMSSLRLRRMIWKRLSKFCYLLSLPRNEALSFHKKTGKLATVPYKLINFWISRLEDSAPWSCMLSAARS